MLLSLKTLRFIFNLSILLHSYVKTSICFSNVVSFPFVPTVNSSCALFLCYLGSGTFSAINIVEAEESVVQTFHKVAQTLGVIGADHPDPSTGFWPRLELRGGNLAALGPVLPVRIHPAPGVCF